MNLSIVILSLWFLESSCGKHLNHPDGDSLGHLGQKKIFVDDVNRILGYDYYKYEDRMDKIKSFEMAEVWLYHYLPSDWNLTQAFSYWRSGKSGSKHMNLKEMQYVTHGISVYSQIMGGTNLENLK